MRFLFRDQIEALCTFCRQFRLHAVVLFVVLLRICQGDLTAQEPDNWPFEWGWSQTEVAQAGRYFWPQFRGPMGDGHSLPDSNPPTEWSEEQSVLWKKEISGKAWSSPIVWGDQIYMTNASQDGLKMSAICLNRQDGKTIWEEVVFNNQETQKDFHAFNSYASPTPIVDSRYIYVSFGAYGTACLDRESGRKVWERTDLLCNHYRGAGSSPIFFRDLLILHMDGFDFQYIVALKRSTGETVWRTDRTHEFGTDNGDFKKAYGTPHIVEIDRPGARELQLLSPAAKAMIAYDPQSGKEIWRVHHDEHSAALRPLFDGKTVYCSTGFSKGNLLAIDPRGSGDITKTNVLWQASRAIGAKPSPILVDDLIVSLEDKGMLTAFKKESGDLAWQLRLGGDFSSSPVYATGKLFCFDEKGAGYVVSVEGKLLQTNNLASGCLASPAIVANDLIVRTRDALYCLRR